MRLAAVIFALLASTGAGAEVTCDQLVAISHKTISLRNDGTPLLTVLADTEGAEMKRHFTPTELDFIRLLIRESYIGAYSPYDVKDACEDGRLAIPVRKSAPAK